MKKYIIDNQLLFNPEDRSLVRIGDDLSRMVLTHISSRLFCLFLESDGSIIPRDTILQKVWDEHSMISSSNNLNNYISGLRKQLISLGLEIPLIITEPKLGFRINADAVSIDTSVDDPYPVSAKRETIDKTERDQRSETADVTAAVSASPRSTLWRWSAAGGIFCLLALVLFFVVSLSTNDEPADVGGLQYVFTQNGCRFYTPDSSFAVGFMKDSRKVISPLAKKYAFSCPPDNIIVYDLFGFFDDSRYSGTVLIARCKIDNGSVISCKSNFIFSVRIDEK